MNQPNDPNHGAGEGTEFFGSNKPPYQVPEDGANNGEHTEYYGSRHVPYEVPDTPPQPNQGEYTLGYDESPTDEFPTIVNQTAGKVENLQIPTPEVKAPPMLPPGPVSSEYRSLDYRYRAHSFTLGLAKVGITFIVNPAGQAEIEIFDPASEQSPSYVTIKKGEEIFIGRDPIESAYVPNSEAVSRKHLAISVIGNQVVVKDCNSSNGSQYHGETRHPEDPVHDPHTPYKIEMHRYLMNTGEKLPENTSLEFQDEKPQKLKIGEGTIIEISPKISDGKLVSASVSLLTWPGATGPSAPITVEVGDSIKIGRNEKNALIAADVSVSREHLTITVPKPLKGLKKLFKGKVNPHVEIKTHSPNGTFLIKED